MTRSPAIRSRPPTSRSTESATISRSTPAGSWRIRATAMRVRLKTRCTGSTTTNGCGWGPIGRSASSSSTLPMTMKTGSRRGDRSATRSRSPAACSSCSRPCVPRRPSRTRWDIFSGPETSIPVAVRGPINAATTTRRISTRPTTRPRDLCNRSASCGRRRAPTGVRGRTVGNPVQPRLDPRDGRVAGLRRGRNL